ncbi:dienelactone hydrolase [Phlebopus sp. FC_14]|nr:dienelactone hydrolase [Phlebopus sp. FC_14]
MSGDLCEDCFRTVKHSGASVGSSITIADVPTYLSEPKEVGSQRKVLLYFSDVFGPFYNNNKLLQDYFASHGMFSLPLVFTSNPHGNVGFTVLGIDYFFGDGLEIAQKDPSFNRDVWREKVLKQAKEHTPKWVEAVRQKYGNTGVKYCAVGYCFGAPYVFDLAEKELIVAASIVHPSGMVDRSTGALREELVQNCNVPTLFSCAETDPMFSPEVRRRTEDILVEKKATYYFQIFSGVSHGFAVRCDISVEAQRWAKEECARGTLEWFLRFSA